ncbi:radical SAM/SPASM domain-containing protein [Methanimicrococcus blatticola]|uniref:MoaA/NifB/PqqE/SkfB family radical SAM enzyme n=1 Tax=Methanimicrococcus blatticola TaxID=91560 RepID=A0A484F2P8_9EURY|nr:radical SAM protein [Methanimicrococcus blatticola]MBZ3935309.1 radical SAM protein [Methanimicrococcus blatticola]MCC2508593.1 radical SAM protein [Methanimicrococcus blatticola]TDQ67900.1 MoaA/NifB/PqqE/SkfB family radical SAM enzyme [Methanimicrococcus blatticola]
MQQPVNVFKMPGLSVNAVRTDEGKINLSAGGFLKFAARPFLSVANKHLKDEKPALVTESAVYPSSWLPPIPSPVFKRLVKDEIGIGFGKYVPETVSIEVTRKFNANAERYAKKNRTANVNFDNPHFSVDPSAPLIEKAIDEALGMGAVVITFTEGDPLLNENIVDYVRYVDKSKAVVMAYTWGLDFDLEKAKQLKEAGLQTLLVSIYSTDPSVHDQKRGISGAYDKAVAAIQFGLEAGLMVTMATHLDGAKVGEMEGLWKLAGDLGVHEFSIWESVPTLEGERRMSDAERKVINDFYRKVNAVDDGTPRIFSNTIFEGEMFGAMAGRRWLHVTTEGEMQPDPYIPFSYGNLDEVSMKTAWKRMRKESALREKRGMHVLYDPIYLQKVREANGWDFRTPKE